GGAGIDVDSEDRHILLPGTGVLIHLLRSSVLAGSWRLLRMRSGRVARGAGVILGPRGCGDQDCEQEKKDFVHRASLYQVVAASSRGHAVIDRAAVLKPFSTVWCR